jgi:hypothetical protein
VIHTTMIWLIASKQIGVRKVSLGRSFLFVRLHEYDEYLLLENNIVANEGWLERKIMVSISHEDACEKSNTTFPGAFIDRVIWALIGSYQTFPAQIVIHSIHMDAEKLGWGISEGLASPRFRPIQNRLETLKHEQGQAKILVKEFNAKYPDFSQALTLRIQKGLRSRMSIHVWDSV